MPRNQQDENKQNEDRLLRELSALVEQHPSGYVFPEYTGEDGLKHVKAISMAEYWGTGSKSLSKLQMGAALLSGLYLASLEGLGGPMQPEEFIFRTVVLTFATAAAEYIWNNADECCGKRPGRRYR